MAQRTTHIIPTEHTFALNAPCIAVEKFYVSDTLTESHWQKDSPKNRGKFEFAGRFLLDLSTWRERGMMRHVIPESGRHGQEHLVAQFDIVMQLVGRSIRCWARYPSQGTSRRVETEVSEDTKLPGTQIHMSIAAAFVPGTK